MGVTSVTVVHQPVCLRLRTQTQTRPSAGGGLVSVGAGATCDPRSGAPPPFAWAAAVGGGVRVGGAGATHSELTAGRILHPIHPHR